MGIDGKYGRVTTERGTIGDDEPILVFRAQDATTPNLIRTYRQLCLEAGSPPHHIESIDATLARFTEWQADHFTKTPTSDALKP